MLGPGVGKMSVPIYYQRTLPRTAYWKRCSLCAKSALPLVRFDRSGVVEIARLMITPCRSVPLALGYPRCNVKLSCGISPLHRQGNFGWASAQKKSPASRRDSHRTSARR
jgi:hypothetical protein